MRKIWIRTGIELSFTDEEFKKFVDSDVSKEELVKLIKEHGRLSGEAYIPENDRCTDGEDSLSGRTWVI